MSDPVTVAGNVLGSVGVALLLIAFVLNATDRISVGYLYTSLNLVGALMAALASLLIGFVPFLVLETVWFAAAATKLVSLRRRQTPLPVATGN